MAGCIPGQIDLASQVAILGLVAAEIIANHIFEIGAGPGEIRIAFKGQGLVGGLPDPGDLVKVEETRPLSRKKRWKLVEIVEKAR